MLDFNEGGSNLQSLLLEPASFVWNRRVEMVKVMAMPMNAQEPAAKLASQALRAREVFDSGDVIALQRKLKPLVDMPRDAFGDDLR